MLTVLTLILLSYISLVVASANIENDRVRILSIICAIAFTNGALFGYILNLVK